MRNVLLRTSSRTSRLTDQPSRTNRSARSSSSSGCGGPLAEGAEVVDGATIPRPKRWCQTRLTATRAVSGLAGSAIRRASSSRPLPTAGAAVSGSPARATDHPAGDDRTDVYSGCRGEQELSSSGVPSAMAGRVGARGVGPRSRGTTSGAATEPGRGRPVEVQQSALDEPGEQDGPGLGIGQAGQRAVAHRRERFGHGPPVTLREGERAIRPDRLRAGRSPRRSRAWPAGLDRRGGRARRRHIPRDRSLPADACRAGPESWCPRIPGRCAGPATSPGRPSAS